MVLTTFTRKRVMMRSKKRLLFLLVTLLPSLPLAVIALLWMHPNVPCPPQDVSRSDRGTLEDVPGQLEITHPLPQPHLPGKGTTSRRSELFIDTHSRYWYG